MNNINYQYFKFLKSILILGVILLFIDFVTGSILKYFYFKQDSGLLYNTTVSIEKTNAEVLIFGSSRANHHYHPEIISNKLNLSYYNLGRDGMDILYHYAILKSVLCRYKPKKIILDFNRSEFAFSEKSYEKLSPLLPYYETHPEIREIVLLRGKYEKIKLLSRIYPYNSLLFTIAIGNMDINKKRKTEINGYIPLYPNDSLKLLNQKLKISEIKPRLYLTDSLKIKYFENFVKLCVHNNIQLFVVISPYYLKSSGTDKSISIAMEISEKYKIPFLTYSYVPELSQNALNFYDTGHLSNQGAQKFTNLIINEIIKYSENHPL